jgi:hypothetical protein
MPSSSDSVRLQMLVRKDARNARGIAELETALRALGFDVTGSGRASVSARATRDVFAAVFGEPPPSVDRAVPFAAPPLTVPASLAGYVDSVSIAPQHTVIRRGRR